MSTNESINRLKSCVSVTSQSAATHRDKLKIPPAFVPDEWVCNHNHKRHSHAQHTVKHKYVRPASKRIPINNTSTITATTKSTRVLSPIQASLNLKATPSKPTRDKQYFKVERGLELQKLKEQLENEKKEEEEVEFLKKKFEKRVKVYSAKSRLFNKLNEKLHELKLTKQKPVFIQRKSKYKLRIKRLRKKCLGFIKKSSKSHRRSDLTNLDEQLKKNYNDSSSFIVRIISAKKKIKKSLLKKNSLKQSQKKRMKKLKRKLLLGKQEANFYFQIYLRKKISRL